MDFHAELQKKLIERGLVQQAKNVLDYCVNPVGTDAPCMNCGGCNTELKRIKTDQKIKKDPYSAAFKRQALNPGGFSFDMSGGHGLTDSLNPMNRQQPRPETESAASGGNGGLDLRRLYPSLFEGVGKHEEPEYVGKHEQPAGLFDQFKMWLSHMFNGSNVGKHDDPGEGSQRRNPGGEVHQIWDGRPQQSTPYDMIPKKHHSENEMMLPLVAAEEIKMLVCEALMVEKDFNIVADAMSQTGYKPLQVLAALET